MLSNHVSPSVALTTNNFSPTLSLLGKQAGKTIMDTEIFVSLLFSTC